MSTVVTPCCGIGSHVGSQNSVGSKWVWESMNPGATVAPPASSTARRRSRRSGPISATTPRRRGRRPGSPAHRCRRRPHPPRTRRPLTFASSCRPRLPFYRHRGVRHAQPRPSATDRGAAMDEPTMRHLRLRHALLRDARRVHAVPARGVPRSGHLPRSRMPTATRSILAGRPRRDVQQRAGARLRPRLPPGLAEGDAEADGVGQSRRDLRAAADAARVPSSASRGCGCSSSRASTGAVLLPVGDGAVGRALRRSTPDALYANLHSFNRWFDETWGFNGEDRIYATALLSLRDLDRSVAELERRSSSAGARVVLLPTGPGVRPLPRRPLLRSDLVATQRGRRRRRVPHHAVLVLRRISPAWGHDADPGSWHMSAWQWMNVYGERPIEDTLSALIFDNLFGRFPGLDGAGRRARRELGAALRRSTWTRAAAWAATARGSAGRCDERPSEIFRRHVRVAPYPEDDVVRIVTDLGSRRLDRHGLRLPARRGARRAGRLRRAAHPLVGRRPAQDHAGQRRGDARAPGEPAPLTVDLRYPPDGGDLPSAGADVHRRTRGRGRATSTRWRNRCTSIGLLGLDLADASTAAAG